MKIIFLSVLLVAGLLCRANDGAVRSQGNQLIPMYETDISVRKEILTIRRISKLQATVTVVYAGDGSIDEKRKRLVSGFLKEPGRNEKDVAGMKRPGRNVVPRRVL